MSPEGNRGETGGQEADPVFDEIFARITAPLKEGHRIREAEEDAFPAPEILDAELDSVRVRIPGYATPISLELHFAHTATHTGDENHTAFLQSKMEMKDMGSYGGEVRYIFPHAAEMAREDAARRARNEHETTPDAENDTHSEKVAEYDLEKAYGMPYPAIRKAFKFGKRYLINEMRTRAGKPPLP